MLLKHYFYPHPMRTLSLTVLVIKSVSTICWSSIFLYHTSMIISTIWFTWAKLISINSWTEPLYSCDGHRRNTSWSNSQANTEAWSEREQETKGRCFESAILFYRGLKHCHLTSGGIIAYCQKNTWQRWSSFYSFSLSGQPTQGITLLIPTP